MQISNYLNFIDEKKKHFMKEFFSSRNMLSLSEAGKDLAFATFV